jgi:hypothetical protein
LRLLAPRNVLALPEQGLDVGAAHPPPRGLLADQREQLVGEVCAVVEQPSAVARVRTLQGTQVGQDGVGAMAVPEGVLDQPLDEEGC